MMWLYLYRYIGIFLLPPDVVMCRAMFILRCSSRADGIGRSESAVVISIFPSYMIFIVLLDIFDEEWRSQFPNSEISTYLYEILIFRVVSLFYNPSQYNRSSSTLLLSYILYCSPLGVRSGERS